MRGKRKRGRKRNRESVTKVLSESIERDQVMTSDLVSSSLVVTVIKQVNWSPAVGDLC